MQDAFASAKEYFFRYAAPLERVHQELTQVMVRAYRAVHELAKAQKITWREAAYRIAIERVAEAAMRRGVQ